MATVANLRAPVKGGRLQALPCWPETHLRLLRGESPYALARDLQAAGYLLDLSAQAVEYRLRRYQASVIGVDPTQAQRLTATARARLDAAIARVQALRDDASGALDWVIAAQRLRIERALHREVVAETLDPNLAREIETLRRLLATRLMASGDLPEGLRERPGISEAPSERLAQEALLALLDQATARELARRLNGGTHAIDITPTAHDAVSAPAGGAGAGPGRRDD